MENLINRLRNSDLKLISKETGIPYDRMYKWVKGKAKPKLEDYTTLVDYFARQPGDNGNSSTAQAREPESKYEAIPLRLADPLGFEATGQKFYTLPDGSDVMQIPVIPQTAWGSYPRGYADPEFYDGFETITIPVDKLHKGTYLSFEMQGDSMVNITTFEMARKSIWPGQRIIGRDLRREQWQYKLHIHSNDAWIIVHRTDGIAVKEIVSHDLETGIIKLHSWNPDKIEHPDFEWNLADVQQIFNVVDPYSKLRPY